MALNVRRLDVVRLLQGHVRRLIRVVERVGQVPHLANKGARGARVI